MIPRWGAAVRVGKEPLDGYGLVSEDLDVEPSVVRLCVQSARCETEWRWGCWMAFMYWSEDFSVHVEEIDLQHQQLVAMLNDLHSAMIERRGSEVLEKILDGLADYTVYHFSTEEDFFDRYNYPDAAIHKQQHAAFVERVSSFRNRVASGDATISIEVLDFLAGWVKNHIRGSDRDFGPFLNSNGVF